MFAGASDLAAGVFDEGSARQSLHRARDARRGDPAEHRVEPRPRARGGARGAAHLRHSARRLLGVRVHQRRERLTDVRRLRPRRLEKRRFRVADRLGNGRVVGVASRQRPGGRFERRVRELCVELCEALVGHEQVHARLFQHAPRGAEHASLARGLAAKTRPGVGGVRHERRNRQDVRSGSGFPDGGAVVQHHAQLLGDTPGPHRLLQRLQLRALLHAHHPVRQVLRRDQRAARVQEPPHLLRVLRLGHRAHKRRAPSVLRFALAVRAPVEPGEVAVHFLPARAHVHEHGRAFVRGVDAREDHLPSAAVRRGQADDRTERHLAGRRRRRLRRRRDFPPAIVNNAVLGDVLREHRAVVLEPRHVLFSSLTRDARGVRAASARGKAPERAGDGFAGGIRR